MTCLLDMWICLVVVVGFIVNCISTGTMFASGTLFLSFLDYFQAGESLTSWIPATQASVAFLTGRDPQQTLAINLLLAHC